MKIIKFKQQFKDDVKTASKIALVSVLVISAGVSQYFYQDGKAYGYQVMVDNDNVCNGITTMLMNPIKMDNFIDKVVAVQEGYIEEQKDIFSTKNNSFWDRVSFNIMMEGAKVGVRDYYEECFGV